MHRPASIAIETSCRAGGVALGLSDALVGEIDFDTSARAAAQVVARLDELLATERLRPADLDEVYVSVGPGSFTGVRVGVTVARTLAQAAPHVRCVGVPTAHAVADNARDLPWDDLLVLLAAKNETAHATPFRRQGGRIVPAAPPRVAGIEELLADLGRGGTLSGEALGWLDVPDGIEILDPAAWVPTAGGVWRVGRREAREGRFTDPAHLLPLYPRRPEAVRLWQQRNDGKAPGLPENPRRPSRG